MRHFSRLLLSLAVGLATLLPVTPALADSSDLTVGPSNRLIVQFEDNTRTAEMASAHSQANATVVDMIPELNAYVVEVPAGQKWLRTLQYRLDHDVKRVEDDPVACIVAMPNDPYYDDLRQWGLFQIGAEDAWDVTHSRPDISIAVLDTGIESTHPDLADKIVAAVDFTGSGSPEPVSNSHGTHVAGIAAASTDNATGVAGLAWDASLMNAKVMSDSGTGYYSWIAAGVIWATDNGADVINMSLSGSSGSSVLSDAINYAWERGVIVVAAAGNDGVSSPQYPAAYENCISVAASTSTDELASWSNHGASWVDVSAPSWAYSTKLYASYTTMQGTSMACPVVAGLAALVFDVASDTNGNGRINDEVRSTIESTCVATGADVQYGRIDAAAAVGTSAPPTTGQVSGTVVDAGTSAPLEGVSVTDGVRSTTTDAQGGYTLADVPAGTYTIEAGLTGYVTASQPVSVTSGQTATADFSLEPEATPNQPPVLDPIGNKSVDENQLLTFAVSASDPDNDPLSYDAAGLPDSAAFADGVFSWTPDDGQDGAHDITFSVSDGALSDSETITITVNAINRYGSIEGTVTDALSGEPVDSATVTARDTKAVTDTQGAYSLDGLSEGAHTVAVSASGYYGQEAQVSVAPAQVSTADFALTPLEPQEEGLMWTDSIDFVPMGSPTPTMLQVVVSVVTPEPLAGAYVFFDVAYSDGGVSHLCTRTNTLGEAYYTLYSLSPQTYTVTVKRVFHADYEWDDSLGITEQSFTYGEAPASGQVVGRVTSAQDGFPIAGAVVSAGTQSATADSQGYYSLEEVQVGNYTIAATAAGYTATSDTVSVTAGGTTTCNLALQPIPNSAPSLDPIADRTVLEGEVVFFTVSATDDDGDELSYSTTGLPAGATFSDCAFSWATEAGDAGAYQVTFTVSDGELSDSSTVSITVEAVPNSAPSLDPIADRTVCEGDVVSFTVSATDDDGDELSYSATGLPAGAMFSDCAFSWPTDVGDAGAYEVAFTVSDGELSDSTTVTITVEAVPNSAPVLEPIGDREIQEGEYLEFTVSASDPDGDALQYSVQGLPEGATFSDCEFAWTTEEGDAGTYELMFTVSDGELSAADSITITISDALEAPGDVLWVESIDIRQLSTSLPTTMSITATVVTPEPLANAYVFMDVTQPSSYTKHYVTRTDSRGEACYTLRVSSPGTYSVRITRVWCGDYTWDKSLGVTEESIMLQ